MLFYFQVITNCDNTALYRDVTAWWISRNYDQILNVTNLESVGEVSGQLAKATLVK